MEATNWHKPDSFGSAKITSLEKVDAWDLKTRGDGFGLKLWGHGSKSGTQKVFYLAFDREEAKSMLEKLQQKLTQGEGSTMLTESSEKIREAMSQLFWTLPDSDRREILETFQAEISLKSRNHWKRDVGAALDLLQEALDG